MCKIEDNNIFPILYEDDIVQKNIFINDKEPFLRPFISDGDYRDSEVILIGINPATPIYSNQISIDDFISLCSKYDSFIEFYKRSRLEQGKKELSRTRLGIQAFSNWISSNLGLKCLETDVFTYPTKSLKELKNVPKYYLELSNELFWRVFLNIKNCKFVIIYGKFALERFIFDLETRDILHQYLSGFSKENLVQMDSSKLENTSPIMKVYLMNKPTYVFYIRHLMYYGKTGNSYYKVRNKLQKFNNYLNKRMLIFDLDGTLLNNKKRVTKYTNDIISKAIDLGFVTVLATGRAYVIPGQFEESFNPSVVITNNGAEIKYSNSETIEREYIDKNRLTDLLSKIKSVGVICTLHYDSYIYTDNPNYVHWKDKNIRFGDINKSELNGVQKITLYTHKNKLIEEIDFLNYGCCLHYVEENQIYTITNVKANKASAIEKICKQFNMVPENVICFGNDENDLSMFNIFDGIAVQNSINDIKELSIDICDNNEQDGVAKWIDTYLL